MGEDLIFIDAFSVVIQIRVVAQMPQSVSYQMHNMARSAH